MKEQNKQCYLLSIGANTTNEERFCSVQSLQQFGQRSLKQVTTANVQHCYLCVCLM